MNTSVTILAHREARETFDRHYTFWRSINAASYTVIVPEGQTINAKDFTCVSLGAAGHACPGSIKRLRWMLHSLTNYTGRDLNFISEYDAIIIGREITERYRGLTGIVMANTEPARFIAPRYVNPPWLIDLDSAVKMSDVAQAYPDIHEEGYADRYLSALAHLAGVPILPFDPPGFTMGTIHSPEHNGYVEEAVKKGAFAFHGIKSQASLDFIQNTIGKKYERLH